MSDTQKPRVLIGYPTGGHPLDVFADSLLELQRFELLDPSPDYEFLRVEKARSIYVASNRRRLVHLARKKYRADYLLMLDDDESFEPDLLRKLMTTALTLPADILFGLYANTQPAPQGIQGGFIFADMIYREVESGAYENIVPPLDNRPFRVDAAGSGVLLTKMSVYDALDVHMAKAGLFDCTYFETPQIQILGEEAEGPREMNEDIFFSRLCREAGLSLYCDPRAEVVHHKTLPLLASPMRRFLERAHAVEGEMRKLG